MYGAKKILAHALALPGEETWPVQSIPVGPMLRLVVRWG